MRLLEILVALALLVVTALSLGQTGTAPAPMPRRTPTTEVTDSTPEPSPTASPTATATATLAPTMTLRPSLTPFALEAVAVPSSTPMRELTFDTRPDLDRYLYVDQKTQRMYVFERGELIREMPCSTGLPDDTTYTEAWEGLVGRYYGTFMSFGVWADEAWYLYPSLGNILVHSLPYVWRNGYKVYLGRDALGMRPASHGCIRLSPEDAAWFTAYNPEGVLMTITEPYRDYWQAVLGSASDKGG
ncbi:MAG: L,D-transpeptidase [Anaerolineae bacterium]